jgi:nucleoside-diphosphate-sugar epimerase
VVAYKLANDEAAQKLAEQAAWAFVVRHRPTFTLATVNNTYTFGPVARTLRSMKELNTSNRRILELVRGRWRRGGGEAGSDGTSGSGGGIPATRPVFTFVDVRDVALAHVRALTVAAAGGQRFYVVGGFFSNARLAGVVRRGFPQLGAWLPTDAEVDAAEDFPADHWRFDNARSRAVLGLEYTGLEASVVDTVESILRFDGSVGAVPGSSGM